MSTRIGDRPAPAIDRLIRGSEEQGDCWVWARSANKYGHGRITVDGRLAYTHRVSYEFFVGPIPDGQEIDHLCRVPACWRPDHLEAVPPKINVRRGESVGARALRRTHCLNGHDYATHGVIRTGRRVCRLCNIEYMRAYNARRRAERAAYWQTVRPVPERVAS